MLGLLGLWLWTSLTSSLGTGLCLSSLAVIPGLGSVSGLGEEWALGPGLGVEWALDLSIAELDSGGLARHSVSGALARHSKEVCWYLPISLK